MIRTFITPHNTDVHITIPANYVGKELEVTVLFTDEASKKHKPKKATNKKIATLADLDGKISLTPEEADEWNSEIRKLRGKWQ